jgi:hypothetical protein
MKDMTAVLLGPLAAALQEQVVAVTLGQLTAAVQD